MSLAKNIGGYPVRDEMRTGYEANLTDQQRDVLNKLMNNLRNSEFWPDFQQNPDGVKFVLRFLRATMKDKSKNRLFQLQPAEERLYNTFRWRRQHKVDDVRRSIEIGAFPPGYDFYWNEVRPRLQWIDPQTGRLVHMEKFGLLCQHVKTDAFTDEQWNQFFIYDLENILLKVRNESKMRGFEIGVQIVIVDMRGFGFGFLNRLRLFKLMNNLAAIHYPELAGPMLLMNTPWAFTRCYSMVKYILDTDTASKFVVSSNFSKELVQKVICDASLLPEEYGGESKMRLGVPLHARKGK